MILADADEERILNDTATSKDMCLEDTDKADNFHECQEYCKSSLNVNYFA